MSRRRRAPSPDAAPLRESTRDRVIVFDPEQAELEEMFRGDHAARREAERREAAGKATPAESGALFNVEFAESLAAIESDPMRRAAVEARVAATNGAPSGETSALFRFILDTKGVGHWPYADVWGGPR